MLLALAIILDTFVKIPLGETGGSLNFAMIPIVIIGLRHGWFKALLASGVAFGLITCLLDGYGFVTYPFSYLLGFGSFALIGCFGRLINKYYEIKNVKKTVFTMMFVVAIIMVSGVLRWVFESISSVLFYETTFVGGLAYNATYVLPSAALTAAGTCLLLPTIKYINNRFQSKYLED